MRGWVPSARLRSAGAAGAVGVPCHATRAPRVGGEGLAKVLTKVAGGGKRNLRSPRAAISSGRVVAHAHASTVQARQAGMEVENDIFEICH